METDISIQRVETLLEEEGITRAMFDMQGVKTFADLEKEAAGREVRFVVKDGKIICYRRAVQVLAIGRSFKYLEVERKYLREGFRISNTKLGISVKDYTFSETVRLNNPGEPPEKGESAIETAVRGASEECGIAIDPAWLQLDHSSESSKLPPVRKSSVYFKLYSCTYARRFLIHPMRLNFIEEEIELSDSQENKDVISIVRQFPTEGEDFTRLK